jgi:hypothetical protein
MNMVVASSLNFNALIDLIQFDSHRDIVVGEELHEG